MSTIVRANSNNSFLQKFLLIAIVCIAFGFWFLYDAAIGYPNHVKQAMAFEEIQATELSDTEKLAKWEKVAKENGWSHSRPEHTAQEWQDKINYWQYPLSVVCFLVGIPVLLNYFRSKNSWVESDGKRLTTSWGKSIDFASVTRINKRKWEVKGIARLEYNVDDMNRVFVLDDFKFDREKMGIIMGQIESIAGDDAIVGGPSQVDIEMAMAEKKRLAESEELDEEDANDADDSEES